MWDLKKCVDLTYMFIKYAMWYMSLKKINNGVGPIVSERNRKGLAFEQWYGLTQQSADKYVIAMLVIRPGFNLSVSF